MIFGLIILAIGVIALLIRLGIIQGSVWGYTWPVLLIIVGLWLILGRVWRRSFWITGFGPCGFPPWRKDRDEEEENR